MQARLAKGRRGDLPRRQEARPPGRAAAVVGHAAPTGRAEVEPPGEVDPSEPAPAVIAVDVNLKDAALAAPGGSRGRGARHPSAASAE